MAGNTAQPQANARRANLLKALHAMCRELALSEDCRRDMMQQVTGRRSAREMSVGELERVCDHLRRLGAGGRRGAARIDRGRMIAAQAMGTAAKKAAQAKAAAAATPDGINTGGINADSINPGGGEPPASGETWLLKARALWLSLLHMGELADGSEAALRSFCRRQTGIDVPGWVSPEQATQIVDALKSWCGRAGFTVPPTERDRGRAAKVALCRVLWQRLAATRAVQIADPGALDNWASRKYGTCVASISHLEAPQLDRAAAALGDWLRRQMRSRGIDAPLSAWLASEIPLKQRREDVGTDRETGGGI